MRTRGLLILAALAVGLVSLAGSVRAGTAPASPAPRAMAVTAGLDHTCALTRSGAAYCWGYNGHAELGVGTTDNHSTPVGVSGLSAGVTAIAAGSRHTCALTSTGGAKCWGANYSGSVGDGSTTGRFTPVDVVGLAHVAKAIAAGYDASCVVTSMGGAKCWGRNSEGQLGDGTTSDRWTPVDVFGLGAGVAAIATNGVHSCALTGTGGVKCWGADYGMTPMDVSGLRGGATAITVSCALTAAGGVECWGGGHGLTAVDVPGLTGGVTAIASGTGHSCALTTSGGVKCWGLNDHGQLGDGTTRDSSTPVAVSGLDRGVTAIAAGSSYSCAVTRVGGVQCWGNNGVGQLGDGTTHDRLTPVSVVGFGPEATLAIISRTVAVTRAGVVPVRLRCGGGARCTGNLRLVARHASRDLPRQLGKRSFSILAGRTQVVRVKLNRSAFGVLLRVKHLSVRVRISYRQPAGGNGTATRQITLEAPK